MTQTAIIEKSEQILNGACLHRSNGASLFGLIVVMLENHRQLEQPTKHPKSTMMVTVPRPDLMSRE